MVNQLVVANWYAPFFIPAICRYQLSIPLIAILSTSKLTVSILLWRVPNCFFSFLSPLSSVAMKDMTSYTSNKRRLNKTNGSIIILNNFYFSANYVLLVYIRMNASVMFPFLFSQTKYLTILKTIKQDGNCGGRRVKGMGRGYRGDKQW